MIAPALFFTAGVMNDFLLNLGLPDTIGRDLTWPALGWGLAVAVPAAIAAIRSRAP